MLIAVIVAYLIGLWVGVTVEHHARWQGCRRVSSVGNAAGHFCPSALSDQPSSLPSMMTAAIDKAEALTRLDHEMSLDEALLLMAQPPKRAEASPLCGRCLGDTDEDGFCAMCGEVTLVLR